MSTPALTRALPFLILCSKQIQSKEEMKQLYIFICTQNYTPKELIVLAHMHGVIPLVYKTIKKIQKETKNIPFCSLLKVEYDYIVQKNMLMAVELLRLVKLFEKHHIPSLSFKGPTLSLSAYGDITLRQYCDLDILIHKKDQQKVLDLLENDSYLPQIKLREDTKPILLNSVNVMGFYKQSNILYIEIHWELLSRNYAINWEEAQLWANTEELTLYQKKVTVLAPEQLLLYLCVHASKHLFERLIWICDIDRMVRSHSQLKWDTIQKQAEILGIQRILYLGLYLSQHFYDLPLPTPIQNAIHKDPYIPTLASKIIDMHFHAGIPSSKSYASFFILLSMREKTYDKFRFAWYALVSVKFDDFEYIQLPRYLSFGYPLVRIWRLFTKYLKKKKTI